MKINGSIILVLMLLWVVSCTAQEKQDNDWGVYPDEPSETDGWRSALYPADWTPGYSDGQGRFLHDFSYAGYHSGLDRIPDISFNVTDVTESPYFADKEGISDATSAIQKAIDDVSAKGGGVVYIPAGTYVLSLPAGKSNVLSVTKNNVIIRGAGPDKTFLKNTTTDMRSKTIISFNGSASWDSPQGAEAMLTEDVLLPSTVIPVDGAGSFAPGDKVMIKSDVTDAFREEHKVGDNWDNLTKGPHFLREVVSVDAAAGTVTVDVPTRYPMKTRDNARMYRVKDQLKECGIENIAIANVQNPIETGWGEEDYNTSGNGSYQVHASHVIKFRNAENCWARNVYTWRPEGNDEDVHILSNGIEIGDSRFVTVTGCNIQRSQYEGGGGNGYMYTLSGNDCLLEECVAEHGRHNYDFKSMTSNGNVLYRCTSKDPSLASDFHMHLSMANLIDGFVADGDHIDASFRPWGSAKAVHMYTTTESVIWNTTGLKADGGGVLVVSKQYGNGYVIGTQGAVTSVTTQPVSGTQNGKSYDTSPEDFVEGVGMGATLQPQSLYKDQLKKRQERL